MGARHIIRKKHLRVTVADEAAAQALQPRLARLAAQGLRDVLERGLDAVGDAAGEGTQDRLIGRLEIDLGTVRTAHLEADLCRALAAQLPAALARALGPDAFRSEESSATGETPVRVPPQSAAADQKRQRRATPLNTLAHFVETGRLPWWAPDWDDDAVDAALARALATEPEALWAALRAWSAHPEGLLRLVRHCQAATLRRLMSQRAGWAPTTAMALAKGRVPPALVPLWVEAIARLLQAPTGSPESFPSALRSALGLADAAAASQGARRETEAETGQDRPAASSERPMTGPSGAVERDAGETDVPGTEVPLKQAKPEELADAPPPVSVLKPGEGPGPTPPSDAIATIAATSTAPAADPSLPDQNGPERRPDRDEPGARGASASAAIRGISDAPPVAPGAMESPSTQRGLQAPPLPRLPAPPETDAQAVERDGIPVPNGGIVLLWPFLTRAFTRLGLLTDDFGPEAQHRAAAVLHGAATGQAEAPEFWLPLNKVLVGLPIDGPAPPVTLAAAELAETDLLLEALRLHAGWAERFDLPELRREMLQRPARLTTRDDHWLLLVDRPEDDDAALRPPWMMDWIKLPWMMAPLMTDW